MADPVIDWLSVSGLIVKREFATAWGVCDLAGCSINSSRAKHRLALGQRRAVGPELRIALLLSIPNVGSRQSTTITQLGRAFGAYVDDEAIEQEVERLRKNRFVEISGRGRIQKRNGWLPLHDRIVAVELKLSRVGDALEQARANQGFADESFVAMPADRAYRAVHSTRTRFREAGVGLLAVSRNSCDVVIAAQHRSELVDEVWQTHAVERFWRSHADSARTLRQRS